MQSRPLGQYALCVLLILAGFVCLGITLLASYDTSVSWGSTDRGQLVYGAASIVNDVVVVSLFACVVGALVRFKRFIAAGCLGAFVCVGLFYTIVTFYQFGAKERLSKTEMAQKTHNAELTADAQTQQRKDAVRNRLLDDLQMEAENASSLLMARQANINRDITRTELNAIRNKKTELAFADIEVKAAPVYVEPDPGAKSLSEDTGLSVAAIQKALVLWIGCMLIIAKPLAFGFGFGLWPKAPAPVAASTAVAIRGREEDEDAFEADNDPEPKTIPQPKAIIHSPKIHVDPVIQVEQFYEEATIRAPQGGKPIQATNLHMYYLTWAEGKNYWPTLNLHNFGRASAHLIRIGKLDMERKGGLNGVYYHGRTPINFEDRQVA